MGAWVLCLVVWFAPMGAQAQSPRDVAQRVHQRGGYGEGLHYRGPTGEAGTFPSRGGDNAASMGGEGASGDRSLLDARRTSRGQTLQPQEQRLGGSGAFGSFGAIISNILLVVVGIALVGLVIILIYSLFQGRLQDDPASSGPGVSDGTELPRPDELPWVVGDPDELAQQGRYSEAILALLVQSLQASGWKGQAQRSRTAREIFRALSESDPRRVPLGEVVRLAERVRFAGDEPTEALFFEVRRFRDGVQAASRAAPSSPVGPVGAMA